MTTENPDPDGFDWKVHIRFEPQRCTRCGTFENLKWYAPLQNIYCEHCIYNIELMARSGVQ